MSMRTTRLIAVLVGLAAIAMVAAEASAYYHPGMGTFMSRDPGAGGANRVGAGGAPAATGRFIPRDPTGSNQYADGMNLYQYVRSAPRRHTDSTGLLAVDADTWWWFWKQGHQGMTEQEYREARRILNLGCVGISMLLTGGTGQGTLTSDCYDSLEKAKERQKDRTLTQACCRKKDVTGDPAKLKIVSMKFWNQDAAGNQIVHSGAGGSVDMGPYWAETRRTGDTPRRGPGYMNFDFGYLHEGLWDTWWHANHGGEGMWAFLSDTWWFNRRADWQSPGLAQVWCVVCNDWKLGPGMASQGQQNPTP